MNNTNHFAEIELLRLIVMANEPKYIEQLEVEWFDWYNAKIVINAWKDNVKTLDIMEFTEHLKKKNLHLSNDDVLDIFREPSSIKSSIPSCIATIKKKYRQRSLNQKLHDLQQVVYSSSPDELEVDIVNYLKSRDFKDDFIYQKVSSNFEGIGEHLLKIGGESRPEFDEILPLRGTVITIASESGQHKTNQGLDILIRYILNNPGEKAILFSKEMSFFECQARVIGSKLKISPKELIRGKHDLKELGKKFKEEFKVIDDNLIIIDPQQIQQASDIASILVNTEAKVWVLDFLQYMAMKSNTSEKFNQVASVIEMASFCKDIAQATESFGVLIAQVRKKSEGRITIFPRLDDIEWAGFIRQISHSVGMCFWPYAHNNKLLNDWYVISWQKVRNGDLFSEMAEVTAKYCSFAYPYPAAKLALKKSEIQAYFRM